MLAITRWKLWKMGWWTPIDHWILGCPRDHPDAFFFGPFLTHPASLTKPCGKQKNPSCPSSSLTVPYVLWGFMMIYMDTIIVPLCCRTAKELHWKKTQTIPSPPWPISRESVVLVPSSSSFIFHGTFFSAPRRNCTCRIMFFCWAFHSTMQHESQKTCPPPIHPKIYPVHV